MLVSLQNSPSCVFILRLVIISLMIPAELFGVKGYHRGTKIPLGWNLCEVVLFLRRDVSLFALLKYNYIIKTKTYNDMADISDFLEELNVFCLVFSDCQFLFRNMDATFLNTLAFPCKLINIAASLISA